MDKSNDRKVRQTQEIESEMQNPQYQKPSWIDAHNRLLTLFPHAREVISRPCFMTPDKILEAATQADIPFESVLIQNVWRSNPEGYGDKEFEDYENLELFDLVFSARPPTSGMLWFIPDECFFDNYEPFLVQGEQLREFVSSFQPQMNQDVLMIWRESLRVTLIHHEGAFFHIFVPEGR